MIRPSEVEEAKVEYLEEVAIVLATIDAYQSWVHPTIKQSAEARFHPNRTRTHMNEHTPANSRTPTVPLKETLAIGKS